MCHTDDAGEEREGDYWKTFLLESERCKLAAVATVQGGRTACHRGAAPSVLACWPARRAGGLPVALEARCRDSQFIWRSAEVNAKRNTLQSTLYCKQPI